MFGSKDSDQKIERLGDIVPNSMTPTEVTRRRRLNLIRDYIMANEGKVLTIKDFKDVSGSTTAAYYILDLMKEGYVVRHRLRGQKGHHYTYTWVDDPTPQNDEPGLDESTLETTKLLLQEWHAINATDTGVDDTARALQQLGATKFVMWLAEHKLKPVEN